MHIQLQTLFSMISTVNVVIIIIRVKTFAKIIKPNKTINVTLQ